MAASWAALARRSPRAAASVAIVVLVAASGAVAPLALGSPDAANTISGPPSTHVPDPGNPTALHLRADENAMRAAGSRIRCTGYGSMRQRAVALASGSAPYQASTSVQPSGACEASGCAASNTMSPSVSVPVLSRQMRSTRASPSTAGSSCTSTFRFASRTAPTANAMLVMSTRPSGIIATIAAIDATAASCHAPLSMASTQPPFVTICALSTSRLIGPMIQAIQPSRRLMEERSSDATSENCLASLESLLANESAPTLSTTAVPPPPITIEPDSTASSAALSTGSDSPVSIDSSSCRRSELRTCASAATWSPARSTSRSPSTTSASATSCSVPSRSTRACGACMSASLSSERLARNSCTEPMIVLAMALNPKSASCQRPMRSSIRKQAAMMALKIVNTLARMMLHALRLVGLSNALVSPRVTRSATSAELSPVALATIAPTPSSHHTRRPLRQWRRGFPCGPANCWASEQALLPLDEIGDLLDEDLILDAVRLGPGLVQRGNRRRVVAGVCRRLRLREVRGDVTAELRVLRPTRGRRRGSRRPH